MGTMYALVVQMSRKNELTGHSTLYCLAVELTQDRNLALNRKSELEKQHYVVDMMEASKLADLK